MIKEAYVSFEVAKILKERGFVESCYGRYSVRSKEFNLDTTRPCNNGGNFLYCAPTHQMAMAWLREEKNCIISIWYTGVCYASDYYIKDDNEEIHDIIGTYETYNEAVEKSLKDVLTNLI